MLRFSSPYKLAVFLFHPLMAVISKSVVFVIITVRAVNENGRADPAGGLS